MAASARAEQPAGGMVSQGVINRLISAESSASMTDRVFGLRKRFGEAIGEAFEEAAMRPCGKRATEHFEYVLNLDPA